MSWATDLVAELDERVDVALDRVSAFRAIVTAVSSGMVSIRALTATTDGQETHARVNGFVLAVSDEVLCIPVNGVPTVIGKLQSSAPSGYSLDAPLTLSTPLAVAQGGTGSGTVSGARSNLGAAPTSAKYIVQVADSELSAEQSLGALGTGIVKNTTTTGVLSIAAQGTDYYAPGGTDVAVADGGTGSSTASGARTNLGAANIAGDVFTGAVTVRLTSTSAFSIQDAFPADSMVVDTTNGIISGRNANDLILYSDNGTTSKFSADGGNGNVVAGGTVRVQSAGTIRSASGSPEDVVTGSPGDFFLQTDGHRPWFKIDGSGNDGWIQVDALGRRSIVTTARADASAATVSAGCTPAWTLGSGTHTVSNTSSGTYLNFQTGAVSGNNDGAHGPAIYRRDWGLECVFHVRIVDITNIRLWAILTDVDPSGNNAPVGNYAGFRFSTGSGGSGPDTNWFCRTCDGTTGAGNDSGVAVAANTEYFLRMTMDSSKVRFYINDVFVIERTTNLPTTTALMGAWCWFTTLTSAAKNGRFGWFANKEGS